MYLRAGNNPNIGIQNFNPDNITKMGKSPSKLGNSLAIGIHPKCI